MCIGNENDAGVSDDREGLKGHGVVSQIQEKKQSIDIKQQ